MAGDRKSAAGLRERKKLATRGYSAATMRQIARRAHVGLGTLFNYAEDKRDLVFLIFNEEPNAVTDVALAAPRPDPAAGVADLRRLLELQFTGLLG